MTLSSGARVACAALCVCGCSKEPANDGVPPVSASAPAVVAPAAAPAPAPAPKPEVESFRTPLPARERGDAAPALRYAALRPAACRAELEARRLPVKAARGKTKGIDTPLQLTGALSGVRFDVPRGLYGFVDCRLVLLLDDLAKELALAGVTAVGVNNTYRPGSVVAKKPRSPARPSQHGRGLAVDITEFRLRDGQTLDVERDWHGSLGARPCGPDARVTLETPAALKLRDLTCAIARGAYCNHLITPNRDREHFNHLHCDIEAGASEVMVD